MNTPAASPGITGNTRVSTAAAFFNAHSPSMRRSAALHFDLLHRIWRLSGGINDDRPQHRDPRAERLAFFTVLWGFIWLGIKALLLARFAGFSLEERREAFRHACASRSMSRTSGAPSRTPHPHHRHDRPPRPLHRDRWRAFFYLYTISTRRTQPTSLRVPERHPGRWRHHQWLLPRCLLQRRLFAAAITGPRPA